MNASAEIIEKMLLAACEARVEAPDSCLQAIRAHLAAGGGRLRARICLDAGLALGLSEAESVRIAAVCELLHNASLIQDDLLDRSTVRRGAPCIWVTHSDAIAVCAGDLMLSAAYGLLADISDPLMLAPALRLVHHRTREVILGQALENVPKAELESTESYYEHAAQGKSASLLSLSLELPLLLTGNHAHLGLAHSVACNFAVAYQIADDLEDLAQDTQEGTLNLALMLVQYDGMAQMEARTTAVNMAKARLQIAEACAALLPNDCARTLLRHADTLRRSLVMPVTTPLSVVESPV